MEYRIFILRTNDDDEEGEYTDTKESIEMDSDLLFRYGGEISSRRLSCGYESKFQYYIKAHPTPEEAKEIRRAAFQYLPCWVDDKINGCKFEDYFLK